MSDKNMSRDILVNLIDPDPDQPRKYFDPAKLIELAQSIEHNGLAVPILLRPQGDRFIIVHGERRWRAVQSLGWESIPAEVRDISPDQARWLALIENIQRDNLSPIEEAIAYQSILDTGLTQEALGQRIGKSQSYIAQKLRLLKLPKPIQHYLDVGSLTEGHARQLLKIKSLYGSATLEFSSRSSEKLLNAMNDEEFMKTWFVMLHMLRPEDQPRVWIGADGMEAGPVANGLRLFIQDIHVNPKMAAWIPVAVWWASLAACYGLSVALLTNAIDDWKERIESAISFFSHLCPINQRPVGKPELHKILWYGYHSDLRHANLLDRVGIDSPYRESYKSPTNCQPWGQQHELYTRLIAQAEAQASGK